MRCTQATSSPALAATQPSLTPGNPGAGVASETAAGASDKGFFTKLLDALPSAFPKVDEDPFGETTRVPHWSAGSTALCTPWLWFFAAAGSEQEHADLHLVLSARRLPHCGTVVCVRLLSHCVSVLTSHVGAALCCAVLCRCRPCPGQDGRRHPKAHRHPHRAGGRRPRSVPQPLRGTREGGCMLCSVP